MKRLALVLAVLLIPAAFVSAESSFGPSVAYFGDISTYDTPDASGVPVFGLQSRLVAGIFRFDFSELISEGYFDFGNYGPNGAYSSRDPHIYMPLDAGLNLDILFLRAGLCVGANVVISPLASIEGGSMFGLWSLYKYNVKGSLDLLLGKNLSAGLEAYYFLNDFGQVSHIGSAGLSDLVVGATVQMRF